MNENKKEITHMDNIETISNKYKYCETWSFEFRNR